MPRPENPIDLIFAPNADKINYPGWREAVGDRAVYRVSGLKEFVRLTKTYDYSGKNGFLNSERLDWAKNEFNQTGWEEYVPLPRNEKTTATQTSINHFKKYIKNGEGSRLSTSLYNACILVLMAEKYLLEHRIEIDVYSGDGKDFPHGLMIVPHVFDLDLEKGEEVLNKFRKNARETRKKSGQMGAEIFADVLTRSDFVFSEFLVSKIDEATKKSGGVVYALRGGKKPSPNERTVYPLV